MPNGTGIGFRQSYKKNNIENVGVTNQKRLDAINQEQMSRIPTTSYNSPPVQPVQALPNGVVSLGNGVYAPAPQQPKSGLFGLGIGGILGGKRQNKTKKSRKGGIIPGIDGLRAMVFPKKAAAIEQCKQANPSSYSMFPTESSPYTKCLDENTTRGTALGTVANTVFTRDNSYGLIKNRGGKRSKKNKKSRKGKGKGKLGKSRKSRK